MVSYKTQKWKKAKFLKIDKLSDLTWKFTIALEEKFEYIAGQFVTIKVHDVARSYSIASYNSNKNIFELLIVKLEGGELTTILFENISEGDNLEIKGPLGKFILPENIDRDLLLICTGTGLAPFRSMLEYIYNNKIQHEKIFLIFGTRMKTDLLCYEQMNDFQKSISDFHYIPVLSREKWEGEFGYVHKQYQSIVNKQTLNNPLFYLCGWRDMISEARNNLKESGFDSKQIKLEIYN